MTIVVSTPTTTPSLSGITAGSILDRVRTQLIDEDKVRWSDEELLRWLSDGQRAIVAFSAGASSTAAIVSLDVGTRQIIPDDGHMLLSIVRNIGSDQITPGRAVRIVSRELLDAQDPDWHSGSSNTVARNYIYDPQEPRVFYVYPPNNGTGFLELVYSVLPGEVTALNQTIVVQEIYQTALVDYVMFRAHQKDSDFAAGQVVSQQYLQLFLAYMGQGEQSQLAGNPNLQLAPPQMTTRGNAK